MMSVTRAPLVLISFKQVLLNSLALPLIPFFSSAFNNTKTQDEFRKNKLLGPLDFAKILLEPLYNSGYKRCSVVNRACSAFLLVAFAPLTVAGAIITIVCSIVAMPFYLATLLITFAMSMKINADSRKLLELVANKVKFLETPEMRDNNWDNLVAQVNEKLSGITQMNKMHDMLCNVIVNALIVGTTAVVAHFFGSMILYKCLSMLASVGIIVSDTIIITGLPGVVAAQICLTLPVLAISICTLIAGLLNIGAHYDSAMHTADASIILQKTSKKYQNNWDNVSVALKEAAAFEKLTELAPGTTAAYTIEYNGDMSISSSFKHSIHIIHGIQLIAMLALSIPTTLCNVILSQCNNNLPDKGHDRSALHGSL